MVAFGMDKSKIAIDAQNSTNLLRENVLNTAFKCIFRFCNPRQNILELYSVLVHVRFATSKAKLDIWNNKLGTRVASRVAERLKTEDIRKLGNIRKISILGGDIAHSPLKKLGLVNRSQ